jgi:integrase
MPPIRVKSGSCVVKVYPSHANVGGKEYPQFRIVWYENGARRRESRKSEQLAIERADEIAKGLARGIAGASLTAEQAASYLRASQILAPTGKPLELVAAEYAEAHAILAGLSMVDAAKDYATRRGVNLPKAMTADVVVEYLKDCQASKLTRIELKEAMLTRFAKAFPGPLSMIDADRIHEWIAGLRHFQTGEPVSGRTQNNYRVRIGAFFNFAKSKGYLAKTIDYMAGVGFATTKRGRASPYSPEEIKAVLGVAEGHKRPELRRLVPYLAVRAFAGVRFYECHRVRLADIHLAEQMIVLDREITKTQKSRTVPIAPNLSVWLKPWAGKDGMLCHGGDKATRKHMAQLFRDAGVKTRHNGLRDSFVSYRMALVKDAGKVAQEAGHLPAELHQSYRAVRLPDGRLISEALAREYFAILPKRDHKRRDV